MRSSAPPDAMNPPCAATLLQELEVRVEGEGANHLGRPAAAAAAAGQTVELVAEDEPLVGAGHDGRHLTEVLSEWCTSLRAVSLDFRSMPELGLVVVGGGSNCA